jgi:hypothetical protein
MGTRALITLTDEWSDKEIVVIYRQMDGYPSCHGLELGTFLAPFTITNGISNTKTTTANGMGCLAAQMIQHFKQEAGVGGIYLYQAGTREVGEDFIYNVSYKNEELQVSCDSAYDDKHLFKGDVASFIKFCEESD